MTDCFYCRRPINHGPDTFEKVVGWVQTRGAKGFRTEEHTGLLAHRHCLDLQKSGINREQQSLV